MIDCIFRWLDSIVRWVDAKHVFNPGVYFDTTRREFYVYRTDGKWIRVSSVWRKENGKWRKLDKSEYHKY